MRAKFAKTFSKPIYFNVLKNVSDWLTVNKLSLNAKKTEYMIIGSYQRLNLIETDPPIYLGTEKIKRVKTIKSLGLMLDETLSWNEQVNAITTKVNRLRFECTKKVKRILRP